MGTTGILVLVATLALFAWVGFRVRGGRQDLDEYVTARSSQSGLPLGLSFFASGMGAWILFAPPEVGAFVGVVAVVGYAVGSAGPFIAFALLGPRFRRIAPRGHSLSEFARVRFGGAFRTYVFVVSVGYMFFFVTAELSAVGAVAAITTGMDARLAIVAVTGVTLAYTAYGGLRASLATDRWQAWLIIALLGLGGIALVLAVDSPGRALNASGMLDISRAGVESALTLIIAITAANLFHQGYWQRLWAARDTRALTRGVVLGSALTMPVIAVVGLLGIVATGAGLQLGDPPAPFFALAAGLADWVGLVVLALGVALVASSIDTLENAIASLIVSERPSTDLRGARVVTVMVMLPALFLALQGYSVLRLFLIADLLCAATVVPVLLGLWKRATSTGALAGAVAGLTGALLPNWFATGSFAEAFELATFPGAVPTLLPFVGALIASTVVAVGVSLAANRTEDLDAIDGRIPALTNS